MAGVKTGNQRCVKKQNWRSAADTDGLLMKIVFGLWKKCAGNIGYARPALPSFLDGAKMSLQMLGERLAPAALPN